MGGRKLSDSLGLLLSILGHSFSSAHCASILVCLPTSGSLLTGEFASLVYFQIIHSSVLDGLHRLSSHFIIRYLIF